MGGALWRNPRKASKGFRARRVDAATKGALSRMKAAINKVAQSGAMVENQPAKLVVDIRVKPSQTNLLESLIEFGRKQGIEVRIAEVK